MLLRSISAFMIGLATIASPQGILAVDTTAPSVPTGVSAGAKSSSQIDVTWQTSSDAESGVQSYKVYRNGTLISTVAAPSNVRRRFRPDSFYNKKLQANEPIHPNSAGMVSELVRQTKVGPGIPYLPGINTGDFSSPIYVVKDPAAPKIPVTIVQGGAEATWSTFNKVVKKGIRIPVNALPATGSDGEIGIWDQVDDVYYDFWQLKKVNGNWQASWGGYIADVSNSDGIIPVIKNVWGGPEAQGATATSLPLMGGSIYVADLKAGVIPHGLGIAIPEGPNKFVYPAQRTDGGVKFFEGPNSIPAGTRFRFPADITINPNWAPIVKMMVAAVRDYGVVVQDRAGAVVFYMEDTRQYGTVDLSPYFGGKWAYELMSQQFPWDKLQVLNPPSPAPRVPTPIDAPPIIPGGSTSFASFSDTGVSPGMTCSYQISAVNSAGLESGKSTPVVVSFGAVADTTPPGVPANFKAVLSGSQINLSWSASTDNVGVTSYQVFNGANLIGSSATTSAIISPITTGTTYSFSVQASDAANNHSARSLVVTVTVPTPTPVPPPPAPTPDTTAPSIPGNPTAVISGTQAKISWTASTDNIGVTGYQIFKTGVLAGKTNATTFTVTALGAGTTNVFTVKSFDAAGNLSAASNPVQVIIPSATPPPVPSPAPAPVVPLVVFDDGLKNGFQDWHWGAQPNFANTTPVFAGTKSISDAFNSWDGLQIGSQTPVKLTGYTYLSMAVWPGQNDQKLVIFDLGTQKTALDLNKYAPGGRLLTGKWNLLNIPLTDLNVVGGTVSVLKIQHNQQTTTPVKTFFDSIQFVDKLPEDKTAPTVPANLKASIVWTNVQLKWDAATDNVEVKGYLIYRNGALLKTSVTNSATDTVQADVKYTYTVLAFDAKNNQSALSNPAVVGAPPTTPTGLAGSVASDGTVNLDWADSSNCVGYNLYRDGVYMGSMGNSYGRDKPTKGLHRYKVQSYNIYGRVSGFSNEISITVP